MPTLPEGGMYVKTYKDTSNIDLSLHYIISGLLVEHFRFFTRPSTCTNCLTVQRIFVCQNELCENAIGDW